MNRKYSPNRRSSNYEYEVGKIIDLVFYGLVLFVIYKLYLIVGGLQ